MQLPVICNVNGPTKCPQGKPANRQVVSKSDRKRDNGGKNRNEESRPDKTSQAVI